MVDLAQTSIEFRADVFSEGDVYVALCPELNVSSFGPTPQNAKEALKEAMAAFVEGCHELGTLEEVLREAGFSKQGPSKAYKILRSSASGELPQKDIEALPISGSTNDN